MKTSSHAIASKKGFSLLEILLVVAAIAILAGIVILALNPAKQLGDTHNAKRRSDVAAVLNAVYQYSIDNAGNMPGAITSTPTQICRIGGTCTNLVDLSSLTTGTGSYIVALPIDPKETDANQTGYTIEKSATTGRITVAAPLAEQGATITVTR